MSAAYVVSFLISAPPSTPWLVPAGEPVHLAAAWDIDPTDESVPPGLTCVILVDGTPVATTPGPQPVVDGSFSFDWSPPAAGTYVVTAELQNAFTHEVDATAGPVTVRALGVRTGLLDEFLRDDEHGTTATIGALPFPGLFDDPFQAGLEMEGHRPTLLLETELAEDVAHGMPVVIADAPGRTFRIRGRETRDGGVTVFRLEETT